MPNAINLNLPNPSPELIAAIRELVSTVEVNTHDTYRLGELTKISDNDSNDRNPAYHNFKYDKLIDKLINDEFFKFFKPRKIIFHCVVIANMSNSNAACLYPHIDTSRSVVLNFVVDCGGPQVSTVFYDKSHEIDRGHGQFFSYDEILPVDTYILKNKWYALNTSRVHSVENIQSTRILISLKIARSVAVGSDFTYTMENLIQDYPELIGKNVVPSKPSTTVP